MKSIDGKTCFWHIHHMFAVKRQTEITLEKKGRRAKNCCIYIGQILCDWASKTPTLCIKMLAWGVHKIKNLSDTQHLSGYTDTGEGEGLQQLKYTHGWVWKRHNLSSALSFLPETVQVQPRSLMMICWSADLFICGQKSLLTLVNHTITEKIDKVKKPISAHLTLR